MCPGKLYYLYYVISICNLCKFICIFMHRIPGKFWLKQKFRNFCIPFVEKNVKCITFFQKIYHNYLFRKKKFAKYSFFTGNFAFFRKIQHHFRFLSQNSLSYFFRKSFCLLETLSMQFYLERTGSTVACVWNIFQPPVLSGELGPSNSWFSGSLDPHRLESTVSCTFRRNRFLSISIRREGLVSSVTPRQGEVSELWTWTIPFASISDSPSFPFLNKIK